MHQQPVGIQFQYLKILDLNYKPRALVRSSLLLILLSQKELNTVELTWEPGEDTDIVAVSSATRSTSDCPAATGCRKLNGSAGKIFERSRNKIFMRMVLE